MAEAFTTFELSEASRVCAGIPTDRRVVLLGESTHGTEEYYRIRAAVTKTLVEERGFRAVVFEADWPTMEAANEYVHRRRATPYLPEDTSRFPLWMWRNQCTVDMFEWAKAQPEAKTPKLFGFDCYSLFESKKAVLDFLKRHDPEFFIEVRDRLAFIDKFDTGFQYADAMVRGGLMRIAGHLQEVLTSIQARLQWGSDKYDCTAVERLSVEQNCEVVLAADEYYTKCVSEPAGSQASWNARDQHMTTTLLRIQAHLDDPKIIVWAHNSHVGDATSTSRGGVDFERNEQWNVGQMVRATFGVDNVWIVGQYTSGGTVCAASRWGGMHSSMKLLPSIPGSYEQLMHVLSKKPTFGAYFTFNTAPFASGGGGGGGGGRVAVEGGDGDDGAPRLAADASGVDAEVVADLRDLLSARRTQRWVGVQYHPATEKQSHYGEVDLAHCYDQIIFCDFTESLKSIRHAGRGGGGGSSGAAAAGGGGGGGTINRRLLKEYRRLMRRPAPGIEAHPLESNILEWYFVLKCEQEPYAGGEYFGCLDFPPEYPMAPPSFKMLTPSGRFLTGSRLCLSMSDFHPETWNPSWSVETLLVGLQSFMYEEAKAIGSITASTAERVRLATVSRRHNESNAIWRNLFAGREEVDQDEVEEAAECESVCRFCFTSDGELISPCMCRGSNEWVHLECLRKWQKQVLLTQPTHPKYQTSIDTICNVCLEPYEGEGVAVSRHDAVLAYTGSDIAALIKAGNLLVSTRESSRENLEIISKHPEVEERLMMWTKAVFLCISASNGLVALGTSQPLPGPPRSRLALVARGQWSGAARRDCAAYQVRHFKGGPCEPALPMVVAFVPDDELAALVEHCKSSSGGGLAGLDRLRRVAPGYLVGDFETLRPIALVRHATRGVCTTLRVVWGYAGWGKTQILAEIARGGWGLVALTDFVAGRPDASLDVEWELDCGWSRIVNVARCAPRSEYWRRGG